MDCAQQSLCTYVCGARMHLHGEGKLFIVVVQAMLMSHCAALGLLLCFSCIIRKGQAAVYIMVLVQA